MIRAFNRDETECQKTNEATRKMVLNYIKSNNRSGLIAPVAMLVLNVATLLIVYVGAARMQSGTGLSAADVVAVVQYVGLIMSGIMTLSWSLIFVPRVKVNVKRLLEILESESIPDATDLDKPALNGNILFDNVSFAYADGSELVLSDVSFEVKAGEKVAIIGGTGSGKSTLVSLLLGFNKPTSGTLAFDGENVEGISGERLRTNVSAVLQKGTIFAGTLRENIGLWQDFTDEQIMEAVRDAQLESFVSSHPEGLDFKLSQGGSNVSGGQKQRIQIARALLKKAAIFLFDDSFSALDFMTESKIRTAIKDKLAPRTVFVVTQRVTGAMNSDKIIVMRDGEVQQIGTPKKIYDEPANAFVADFIGESNIIDGVMVEDKIVRMYGHNFLCLDKGFAKNEAVDVVVRPEDIDIVPVEQGQITGVVTDVTFKGMQYDIIVDFQGFKWLIQTTDHSPVGSTIGVKIDPDGFHIMKKSEYSGLYGDYSSYSEEYDELSADPEAGGQEDE